MICISCQSQTTTKKQNTTKNQDSKEIEAIENGLLLETQAEGDVVQTFNIIERMNFYKVPGVSITVVENGKIKWAKGYGTANTNTNLKVDENTIFQAGSISKPIAALALLQLVEKGILDLDVDVNTYLKDWKVPNNEFTKNEKVTLRRLLTHTAGVTVHGFPGYKQSKTIPTTTQVLNGEGNTPKIFVDTVPGTIWRYSGGGYTIAQKVVEEMTQQPFETYVNTNVLKSIGMKNSTFEQPLANRKGNISAAYDYQGRIIDGLWHNYPEKAAAGLWTTPSDLAKYCIEIQEILKGKENAVLTKETVVEMLKKHKNDWGLGPSLQFGEDFLIFRHGGKNAGFTNRFISFSKRGTAVIIMTNADNGNSLIDEILRAISNYYDLGISSPRIVKAIKLSNDKLSRLTGKYKLNYQVPNIGDYFIEISIKDDKLFVNDPNNGDTKVLTALGDLKFIDLAIGDEGMFQIEDDKVGLVWGLNRFQFYKVDE